MQTHDVVIWSIRNRKGRAKPYQLRWKVGTEPKSKAFLTKALADSKYLGWAACRDRGGRQCRLPRVHRGPYRRSCTDG